MIYDGSSLFSPCEGAKRQIHAIRVLQRLPDWRNSVNSHVGAKDFRDQNRAICRLIILHDGDPGAAEGEAGAVQSVNEVTLAALFGFEANAGPAGLKRFAVRAGRNFAEFAACRQPDFEVVSFRGGKAHVSSAEQDGAIVKPEFLKYGFRISYQ